MRNLGLGRRHLVNAYEVKAGIGVIAGNTLWSMPERLECEVLQKARYINTLTFTFYLYSPPRDTFCENDACTSCILSSVRSFSWHTSGSLYFSLFDSTLSAKVSEFQLSFHLHLLYNREWYSSEYWYFSTLLNDLTVYLARLGLVAPSAVN